MTRDDVRRADMLILTLALVLAAVVLTISGAYFWALFAFTLATLALTFAIMP